VTNTSSGSLPPTLTPTPRPVGSTPPTSLFLPLVIH
jgi:hypothetical protein